MSTPLDGLVATITTAMPPPAPRAAPVAPGLAATVYDGDPERVFAELAARGVRPSILLWHTAPDPAHATKLARLRATQPGLRVWYQVPGNPLAGMSTVAACRRSSTWARTALALGAEVLSINGEGRSAPGRPGWNARNPEERKRLGELALALLRAAAAAAPTLVLAWSSHDCFDWHHLPWECLLGPDSPVRLHLPQHYPARKGAVVGWKEARQRFLMAGAQILSWADGSSTRCPAGKRIREDLAPGGAGYVVYTQVHGLDPAAVAWVLDRAPLGATWAHPTRSDEGGELGMRVDLEARGRAGAAPGRIARAQAAVGVAADGVAGPVTRAALGAVS